MFGFRRPAVPSLSPQDVLDRLDSAVVLDVRTPAEYAEGHVVGAVNVDVMAPDFRERVADLDRDAPTFLYCRSGNRSGTATGILREMGFGESYNVGGFSKLAQAGAPVER